MLIRCVTVLLACVLLQGCAPTMKAQELAQGKRNFASGDYKKSFRELLPLACEGNAEAQYALGYMYYYGYGTSQDIDTGIFWMQKAAAQHYQPAVKALQALK